jgi:hypothetical protein
MACFHDGPDRGIPTSQFASQLEPGAVIRDLSKGIDYIGHLGQSAPGDQILDRGVEFEELEAGCDLA